MATTTHITHIEPGQLFLHLLPPATRRAFLLAQRISFLNTSGWYLAGGTALALQTGHRQSVDLDFFTPRTRIPNLAVERALLATKKWEATYRESGTLYGKLAGAKMSFISYPFFIPSKQRMQCGAVRILFPHDIAAMKIIAISQRGRKRDFVDLYWYCRNREPLFDIILQSLSQYPGQEHNINHIIKSLTYFADAEHDPMPKCFFKVSWPEIKRFLSREATETARKLLKLD